MMPNEQIITEIRTLITEANMEEALAKTRQWLDADDQEAALVKLDMISAEWYDVRTQTQNGLLSVDDQNRLNNISRAKLLSLVLTQSGNGALAKNLEVDETPNTPKHHDKNAQQNNNFKNGLKNAVGVLFFMVAAGGMLGHDYIFAVFMFLSGIICFVPSLHFIEKSIGFQLLSWHKYLLLLVFIVASVSYTKVKPANPTNKPIEHSNGG